MAVGEIVEVTGLRGEHRVARGAGDRTVSGLHHESDLPASLAIAAVEDDTPVNLLPLGLTTR
jgi:hypothetical protein